MGRVCFYCGKPLEEGQGRYIIALDRPNVNLMVHRPECIAQIEAEGTMVYLQANIDRILESLKTPLTKKK